ncbi:MAG: hypothetical protein KA099_04900 [Alphaproteobacteria bacterium]|nr:hypothetical protein [Alphaproteobacteria bacterium]MBP7758834.1 hypothetical protein [Alphaproteobacteria bacterium]MBP7762092.1 hypothetical protein [Alphaproteobacteria bacterium]MBP7904649.1 hypothetical protein [Alphaproteobacteria bacterium]
MDIPSAIAAETAMARQNVALSVIKQNAQQAQQVAKILEESLTVTATSGRGSRLDIKV